MAEDVRLDTDQFLDLLHLLARDGADPATVANPPARIHVALARVGRRRQMLDRQRWQPATSKQMDALTDPENVEWVAITKADWEIGKRDLALPPDLIQAIEEQVDGFDEPEDPGCDASQQETVRRSLHEQFQARSRPEPHRSMNACTSLGCVARKQSNIQVPSPDRWK